jgi:hypothetical protein
LARLTTRICLHPHRRKSALRLVRMPLNRVCRKRRLFEWARWLRSGTVPDSFRIPNQTPHLRLYQVVRLSETPGRKAIAIIRQSRLGWSSSARRHSRGCVHARSPGVSDLLEHFQQVMRPEARFSGSTRSAD